MTIPVCAAVVLRSGMVLLARRGPGRKHAGKWEFPGGRIEEGEAPAAALARELREELGIEAEIGAEVARARHVYDFGEIELIAMIVSKYSGALKLIDHDEIAWVEARRLLEYDLAPADIPIAEAVAAHRRRKRYKSTHPRTFEEKYKELGADPDAMAKAKARGSTPAGAHLPIMVGEVLEALGPLAGAKVLDCTLGWGGHAEELARHVGPEGSIIGLDRDGEELARAAARLRERGVTIVARQTDYAGAFQALKDLGIDGVDALLADLGVSSMQLDRPERGMSFKNDGPLDMRMDRSSGKTGAEWLAAATEAEIADALIRFGDEPDARKIAAALVLLAARGRSPKTTSELAAAVGAAKGLGEGRFLKKDAFSRHPAARTFQAMRIVVNSERESLARLLRDLPGLVRSGGRAAFLTFHSGEETLVHDALRAQADAGLWRTPLPEPRRPSPEEVRENPRARSARLWRAVRILPGVFFLAFAPRICLAAESEADLEPIIITATRITEDVAQVPASVTVIGGAELRDRGAYDLRSALSLASGVDIAPGGDPGPAASVPEFWGLKEFDAYLLVVDGVPWGGAFNPALATLDLRDVERIEVVRGAAPVMYGATSFVGVVHVIHKDPSKAQRSLRAFTGSWNSRGGGASVPLESFGKLQSMISADIESRGFRDPRTRFDRDHAHWRGRMETGPGILTLDADASLVRSKPASPVLVQGGGLSSQIPLDANQNPADAYVDEDRYTASAGLDHPLSQGTWSTLVSYSRSAQSILRGFVTDIASSPDAHGFRESIDLTDVYLDSHVQWLPNDNWKLVGGLDHIHGWVSARGGDFDYFVNPNGSAAPTGDMLPSQADVRITDRRDFSGLYGFTEWEPHSRLLLEAGVRLNRTEEARRTSNLDLNAQTLAAGAGERRVLRPSGTAAATFKAWSRGRNLVNVFASYRNSFKPSAVDFGLDTPAQILDPETAQSWEAGAKSRWLDDHFDFNASLFQMDFRNLVLTNTIGGNPTLSNSGSSRFRGLELESAWHPVDDWTWQAAYSLHDNRLPLAARNMFATGLTFAPKRGLIAGTQLNYVGGRFLDRTNTAWAKPYAVWSAGAGWREGGWEARLDGRNITDQRPPVSASEMGDGQVYLLPARTIELSTSWNF